MPISQHFVHMRRSYFILEMYLITLPEKTHLQPPGDSANMFSFQFHAVSLLRELKGDSTLFNSQHYVAIYSKPKTACVRATRHLEICWNSNYFSLLLRKARFIYFSFHHVNLISRRPYINKLGANCKILHAFALRK